MESECVSNLSNKAIHASSILAFSIGCHWATMCFLGAQDALVPEQSHGGAVMPNRRNGWCFLVLAMAAHAHPARSETANRKPNEVAQSASFVVTAPTEELASVIAQEAERVRDQVAREWLGEPLAADIGKAVIIARISDGQDRGHTWPAVNPKRPAMVWLHSSREGLSGPLVAHEVTHVVLSSRYPGQLAPWVNEGIASRQDSAERKAIRQRILASYVQTGQWPPLERTLRDDQVLAADQATYAVASSLVDYLLALGTRATLLAFAVEGQQSSWNQALQHHYAIASIDALQQDWQRYVGQAIEPGRGRATFHGSRSTLGLVRGP
jgi:hypothetical protein